MLGSKKVLNVDGNDSIKRKSSHKKRRKSSDTSAESKRNSSNSNDGTRERRKSSIPFAGREPKVRFLKIVDERELPKSDSPLAVPDKRSTPGKSLLKKSRHPILVNFRLLKPDPVYSISEELEECSSRIEYLVKIFAKALVEARAAVDILTFPVASSCLKPCSRFQGSMIVCIISVEKIYSLVFDNQEAQEEEEMKQAASLDKLIHLLQELVDKIKSALKSAKKLRKDASNRYDEWRRLLGGSGPFCVEHGPGSSVTGPVYSERVMPEKVVMYEDAMDETDRYMFDGFVNIYRKEREITVFTEYQKKKIVKYFDELDPEQCQVIAEGLVETVKGLITFSHKYMETAIQTIEDPELDSGYSQAYLDIAHLNGQTLLDELWAYELNTNLKDIVDRKEILLNMSNHLKTSYVQMEKFTTVFTKYCTQVSNEIKTRVQAKAKCCGCIQPLTADKCMSYLEDLKDFDFMICLPLTDEFEEAIFQVEPTPLESRSSSSTSLLPKICSIIFNNGEDED